MNDPTQPSGADVGECYRRDGFVRLPGRLDPAAVAAALDAVERLEADPGARRRAGAGVRARDAGLSRLVMVHPPDAVLALAESDAVMDAAASCLGDGPAIAWGYEVLTKWPAGNSADGAIGWHQDLPYFAWWEGPTMTAWIALTDTEAEAAPVTYVPGSHRWGSRFDTSSFDATPASTRSVGPPSGAAWTETMITGPAGTVALHHPGTVHGSPANRDRSPRRALAVRLRAATTRLREDTPRRLRRTLER